MTTQYEAEIFSSFKDVNSEPMASGLFGTAFEAALFIEKQFHQIQKAKLATIRKVEEDGE